MKSRMFHVRPVAKDRNGLAKTAAIVGLGIAAVVASALAFAYVMGNSANTPSAKLNVALQAAQRGDLVNSSKAIQGLEIEQLSSPEDAAKLHLLQGAELLQLSHTATLKQAQFDYLDKALAELKKSSEVGFPAGFEGLGNYLLGSALYQARKFDEAFKPLELSINRYPKERFDSMDKLVRIKLHEKKLDVPEIVRLIDQWTRFPTVRNVDIDRAHLALANMHEQLNELPKALEVLNSIPPDSEIWPEAELEIVAITTKELRNACKQPDGKIVLSDDARRVLSELVSRLEVVVDNMTASRQVKGRAQYLMSQSLHDLNRSDEALTYLSAVRGNSPQTIEALAASVATIAVNADLKRWQDAIQTLRILNSGLGDIRWYENDWIPLPKIYESLLESGQKLLLGDARYETIEYCDRLPVFIKDEDRLRIKAPALAQLAELQTPADPTTDTKLPRFVSKKTEAKSDPTSKLYRDAAQSFEKLANLQMIAPDYPDLLWSAIKYYSQSEDFNRSNLLLDRYLNVMPRSDQPKAYLQKAENYFNNDQPAAALESLNQCISIAPEHPKSHEARFFASQILQNESRNEEAIDKLLSNLYDGSLTPNSQIWRASLFELGLLLCRTGGDGFTTARAEYDAASPEDRKVLYATMERSFDNLLQGIQRLEEAIRRYPDDDRKFQCLYRIAESYRTAAEFSKLKLNSVLNSPIDLRETYRDERDRLFKSSRDAYAKLREMLTEESEAIATDEYMRRLLRNSYLGEADLLYEMQEYDKALGVYRSAANRFVSQPISLEALTRSAQCLQQMGRTAEAGRAVAQAYDLVARIDGNDPNAFIETTRGSKEEWLAYLDWLKSAIR